MEKPVRTYVLQREENATTMSLIIFEQNGQEQLLHLTWNSHLGQPMEFAGLSVPSQYLRILQETELLHQIAQLPLEISLPEVVRRIKTWGFVRDDLM
jgi:hypothetical protein